TERMKSREAEHARVLEIPLCPAAIPRSIVDDIRRHFLPAALELGELPHLEPGAAHEGGLDEVVAEDVTAERRLAGEARERAVLRKGTQAHDRVMAPVVAVPRLPPGEPRGEHRALQARGELNEAAEEGLAAHADGERLENPDLRVGLHGPRERDESLTTHHAVGIEHQHAFVIRSPAPHEVGDVAGLALAAVAAAAVEDAARAVARGESLPHPLLIFRDACIARVGENEKIESALLALAQERGPGRGQSRADADRVL